MNYQAFSVAMSVYKNDSPDHFDRALRSIIDEQTIKPDEIVLVIDGPVSNEIDNVIQKYSKKSRFNTIRLSKNGGLGNALKIATENCSNELVARMDSDDVAVKDRFEQQLNAFNDNKTLDILGGDINEFIEKEDNIVSARILPTKNEEIKKMLKRRCPLNHMTVMFKKNAIMRAGGYIDWHYNEDYFLWIRMFLNKAVFANTGTVLVNVRTGKEQLSRRGGITYFKSEKGIQKYMLNHKVIGPFRYAYNCFVRFVVQVMMPNSFRNYVYRRLLRKKK